METISENTTMKFYIEPGENDWVLKKEDGHFDIKKSRDKDVLILFARDFCKSMLADLIIFNEKWEIEESILFSRPEIYSIKF